MGEVQSAGLCESLPLDLRNHIKGILSSDDKIKFVAFFTSPSASLNKFQSCSSTILEWICSLNAVDCATALLNEETELKVDVNAPFSGGYFPLHLAAKNLFPGLVELFLCHGARTDIICGGDVLDDEFGLCSLKIALKAISIEEYLNSWTPTKFPLLHLIIVLCLPKMNDALRTIELLARSSKKVEIAAYNYATQGKIIELAVLLTVARGKVATPITFQSIDGSNPLRSITVSQYIQKEIGSLIDEQFKLLGGKDWKLIKVNKKKMMVARSMRLLFDVFERAGDDISKYLQWRSDVTAEQVASKIFSVWCDFHLDDIKKLKSRFDGNSKTYEWIRPMSKEFLDRPVHDHTRQPTKIASEKAECRIQQLPLQFSSHLKKRGPCIQNRAMTSSKPLPHQAQRSFFMGLSYHSNQVSQSFFGSEYCRSVDVQVKKRTKAIEECVPKFMPTAKWAYFALTVKRGLRGV